MNDPVDLLLQQWARSQRPSADEARAIRTAVLSAHTRAQTAEWRATAERIVGIVDDVLRELQPVWAYRVGMDYARRG